MSVSDVQNGMFSVENPVFHWEKILFNVKHLIASARHHHIPIFYIQHNEPAGEALEQGSEAWEFHRDITPNASDIII
ncbi:isochorismatase family protein [Paenibacillus dendritiformis]|uniref:isochorismatase family protein n=1 Tax=Paenibacillus dendritiformis TaxID=130049 RepID=UPI003B9745A6